MSLKIHAYVASEGEAFFEDTASGKLFHLDPLRGKQIEEVASSQIPPTDGKGSWWGCFQEFSDIEDLKSFLSLEVRLQYQMRYGSPLPTAEEHRKQMVNNLKTGKIAAILPSVFDLTDDKITKKEIDVAMARSLIENFSLVTGNPVYNELFQERASGLIERLSKILPSEP